MLVNLYKNQTPIALFTLPIMVIILSLPVLLTEPANYQYTYDWLTSIYSGANHNTILFFGLTVVTTLGNALLLNFSFNRNDFFGKNSYLPGLFYLLCLFSLDLFFFSPNLIAHLFVILSAGYLLGLRRQEECKDLIFKASFSMGIAISLCPALLPLLLLPWFGLIVFRPFVWREYFMVLLGVTLPSFFHLGIYFALFGNLDFGLQGLAFLPEGRDLSIFGTVSFAILGLLIIYSGWKYIVIMASEVVRFKKLSRVLFHLFWLCSTSYALEWYLYDQIIFVLAIPFALVVSVVVLHIRNLFVINFMVILWFISSALKVFL